MQIKDLFSHKIHSSGDDWPEKLIELASIFYEFDNKPFDREAIEKRLSQISPRASIVARDPSKFRDEISAYPAYLGLYRVDLVNDIWFFYLSETAKQFLVCEEPNVPAFMLLQMCLFQYPNGMGVAYTAHTNKVRIQANTRVRTLEFIQNNIHLSPFRLMCKALEADSIIQDYSAIEATVSFDEIFILANHPSINCHASPDMSEIINVLNKARAGLLQAVKPFESRFHILRHTGFIETVKGNIKIRTPANRKDELELLNKLKRINAIELQYTGFDGINSGDGLLEIARKSSWGLYFDGVVTLDAKTVSILTSEKGYIFDSRNKVVPFEKKDSKKNDVASNIYEFKKRSSINLRKTKKQLKVPSLQDLEITRIKRQRANLNHKIILQQLEDYLEEKGADPVENEHIDLYAQIPNDGKFLFEVKSISESNLLSQTRKGVSQLYEYRFRYRGVIGYDVNLCLVYPEEPTSITWLQEYICSDRNIAIIWFNSKGELEYSKHCGEFIQSLAQ